MQGITDFVWVHDSPEEQPTAGQQAVELVWNVSTQAVFVL